MFNFGLVMDKAHKSSPCIPLVRKLASYMIEVEKEDYFVSNEETKQKIPGEKKGASLHALCRH